MASSDNAEHMCLPATGEMRRLPFFSRYHCEGSDRLDFCRQDVLVTPGLGTKAFGYCFKPPIMVGHIVQQHIAEGSA